MPDVTKRFRWGKSFEAILHHFSTPEIRGLQKSCRKKIGDFTNPELEGEGYRCTVIAFEMFEYGFSLVYDFDQEIWNLEVITQPEFGSPGCGRKPPRPNGRGGSGGSRRAVGLERLALLTLHRKVITAAQDARAILNHTRIGFGRWALVRAKYRSVDTASSRVAACIQLLNQFAEQGSHGCKTAVRLVGAKVTAALSFMGPLWAFEDCDLSETLWDPALFGHRLEPVSG